MKARPADLVLAALQQHRAGRLPAALALYRQAAKEDKRDALAPRLLALALAAGGDLQEALRWIEEALKRDPAAIETEAAQAQILVQAGRQDVARKVLEQLLARRPDFAPAHHLLVHIATMCGTPSFLKALRNAATNLPQKSWPHQQLGRFLAAGGDYKQAVEPLAKAASLRPNDADAQYDLGVALQESGQTQAAISAYRKALALQPGMVRARHNLASALQSRGDIRAAIAEYTDAYKREPASFPRIAQDLAAGSTGQVWLRAGDLKAKLSG